jgi:lysophospholipase L1-like esterase
MKKVNKISRIKKNILLAFGSIFIFLLFINLILFFSTKKIQQKKISKKILIQLPIELTYLYPDTYDKLENITVILGDSHAFGSGDSFLNDDYNYSIGHFLYNYFDKKENFLNIGNPGGGSQSIYQNYLNFRKKLNIKPDKIIYLFYEGNDLENNIYYENIYSLSHEIKSKIRYYFPFVVLTKKLLRNVKSKIKSKINKKKDIDIIDKNSNQINFKNDNNIISLNIGSLQSPPIELNENDLNKSLNIFFETLINLKNDTKEIILVYLPAPTSTLNLKNPIYFQKYFSDNNPNSVTKEELEKLSKYIRLKIKKFSIRQDIKFLDMTDTLKKKSLEIMIYGPKDYKHFNKFGYEIISNQIYKIINND